MADDQPPNSKSSPSQGRSALGNAPASTSGSTPSVRLSGLGSETTRLSSRELVTWTATRAIEHPLKCLRVMALNVVVLALTLTCVATIGVAFDIIVHRVEPSRAAPRGPWGITLPVNWESDPFHGVCVLAVIIVLLAGAAAFLRYWAIKSQAILVQTVQTRLRAAVYDKLQRLSFRFFDANETGSIINRATGDCAAVAQFSEQAVIQIVILSITLAVNLIYMLSIHGWLTLACLSPVPVMLLCSAWYSLTVRPSFEESRKRYDKVIRVLSENIQGQHVIKGFALEQAEVNKFKEANDEFRSQQRWLFKRTALYNSFVGFLSQSCVIIVLGYGGWLVVRPHEPGEAVVTFGNLVVFATLLGQFASQVQALANMATTLQTSLTAAGRVREVLDAPLEISSAPDAIRMPKAKGRVEFRNVTFGYNPAEPVLREVNLVVEPGQCVAVLGATGSGKSTLLSLIPRFYDPQQGQVLIDGVDARKIQLDDLRRNIGLVFQESFLFSNTVASNVAFGNPEASRESIEKAAKIAAAHGFVSEMEKGYDTVVGEYGSNLSGGQRQRLAIARAVLLEPAILILDDATAAIDPETEQEILEAMDNAMQGRTTFVVAHRLSTLRRADFIIVLDHGKITQVGTHEQLMSAVGHYREVATLQTVDDESAAIIQARMWYEGQTDTPLLADTGDLR